MAHLLHIDSSIQGDRSVSRKLTARARGAWLAAHPGGTVTYRDLGSHPLPHFDTATGLARLVPPEQRTPRPRPPRGYLRRLRRLADQNRFGRA
jgi:FMN-dependent NADH-azoreductase